MESVPNVAFVEFDLAAVEKVAIFILECDATMMLFLTANIAFERGHTRLSD